MSERNANDSIERIDENPSRDSGEATNNPPADSKSASKIPHGTDEEPPRTERVKARDEKG